MCMATESLESYYSLLTSLQFDHKLNLVDMENMFPFELDVYVSLRIQELERRKQEK